MLQNHSTTAAALTFTAISSVKQQVLSMKVLSCCSPCGVLAPADEAPAQLLLRTGFFGWLHRSSSGLKKGTSRGNVG
jgi:hypothetical protein